LSGNRAHNTGGGLGNSPNYLQLDAGGAIYANDSQVVISTSDIEENFAYGAGGGILVLGGNAKILQSNISRNKVGTRSFSSGAFYELGGGGIFIADSTLDLIRSTVDRNVDNGKFRAGQGGGILSARTTTRILESTISYNRVNSFGSGGGLSVVGGKALLFKSDFVGNRSYAERRTLGVGAGVSVRALSDQPLAQLTVRGGSFIDNFSEFGGSGLYVTNAIVNIGSTADGESTLFRNNRVESGLGGAFRFSQQERQLQLNESVVIRDAIFENNRGGAADIYAAEIDIQNSRFSQNKNSLSGAPIRVTGRSISLTDNLFENNTPLGDLDVLQRIV